MWKSGVNPNKPVNICSRPDKVARGCVVCGGVLLVGVGVGGCYNKLSISWTPYHYFLTISWILGHPKKWFTIFLDTPAVMRDHCRFGCCRFKIQQSCIGGFESTLIWRSRAVLAWSLCSCAMLISPPPRLRTACCSQPSQLGRSWSCPGCPEVSKGKPSQESKAI